ncbi:major allergen Pru ar 1-like [Mangifera indica]|uniref:major allergen Pru ar 1-like n=1 Tax=Mangifera indica TaxID=29780 RepID=UPI001CFB5629|nr:major allergen Pru ar 1-like [Mangifera indica]UYO79702.1 pathogenesis-related protein [Mangifera indica]
MGVLHHNSETTTAVAPSRMFQAFILDSHNLLPKLAPQSFKNIELIEGDGGVGSIKLINFPDGSYYKYMKHRIDVLDKENFVCKYTLIEGDSLGEKLESVVYEVKFEPSGNGGSICKVASEYHTKGDHEIKEEVFKASQEKAAELYKVVEAHLLANPDLYA